VAHLERLVGREDRAALAALRRGLGRPAGSVADMYPYVIPYLPPETEPWAEAPYYLVASLFALHQGSWPHAESNGRTTDFGASYARLSQQLERESIEARFVALLDCDLDELPQHLRQAVALLKSREVPIDWLQLLRDVRGWGHPERYVQRAWARAYWGAPRAAEGGDAEETGSDATTTDSESQG
jgi:CRISPR system Cascade subunit CasB